VELAFWAWVITAVILGVGEILSSGLYLLPFCVGATSAAGLNAAGMTSGWQWIAFVGVSSVLTIVIRRIAARREKLRPPSAGHRTRD